jgi:hypothetical protein
MRNHVRHNRSERSRSALQEGDARELASVTSVAEIGSEEDDAFTGDTDGVDGAHSAEDGDDAFDEDFGDVVTLTCPDCGRPIAVFTDEDSLPEHALCPTPWNPFGLTVCHGSGRAVTEARPLAGVEQLHDRDEELGTLLTLPAGIDWRTQPFSHVGGPGSRPIRVPEQRLAA